MSPTDLLLREILTNVKDSRGAIDDLSGKFSSHDKDDAERHGEVMKAVAVLETRQTRLSDRVTELEKEAEVTGVHSVEELRQRYRSNKALLIRLVIGITSVVLGFLGHKLIGWP